MEVLYNYKLGGEKATVRSDVKSVWHLAAADLGIRVTAPFTLTHAGKSLTLEALVHDFGSDKGMLLFAEWDKKKAEAAEAQGFGYSCISSAEYVRADIIEALCDWGWSGLESEKPKWCTAPQGENDEDA